MTYADEHEQRLYEELRVKIEDSVRTYLQRTHRPYPINIVFDLSDLIQQ